MDLISSVGLSKYIHYWSWHASHLLLIWVSFPEHCCSCVSSPLHYRDIWILSFCSYLFHFVFHSSWFSANISSYSHDKPNAVRPWQGAEDPRRQQVRRGRQEAGGYRARCEGGYNANVYTRMLYVSLNRFVCILQCSITWSIKHKTGCVLSIYYVAQLSLLVWNWSFYSINKLAGSWHTRLYRTSADKDWLVSLPSHCLTFSINSCTCTQQNISLPGDSYILHLHERKQPVNSLCSKWKKNPQKFFKK